MLWLLFHTLIRQITINLDWVIILNGLPIKWTFKLILHTLPETLGTNIMLTCQPTRLYHYIETYRTMIIINKIISCLMPPMLALTFNFIFFITILLNLFTFFNDLLLGTIIVLFVILLAYLIVINLLILNLYYVQ